MFQQMSPMVKNLVIINVALFIGSLIMPSIMNIGHLEGFTHNHFQPYQLLTHMFLHGGFMHVMFNMLGLISLGSIVEKFLGEKKFILLYMTCGIGGAILYNLVSYIQISPVLESIDLAASDFTISNFNNAFEIIVKKGLVSEAGRIRFSALAIKNTLTNQEIQSCLMFLEEFKIVLTEEHKTLLTVPIVGASGAISGVVLIVALYFPNTEMQVMFIPVPIKAKYLVTVFVMISIFLSIKPEYGGNIAHLAHLTGMIPAVIFYFIWKRDKRSFY